MCDDGWYPEQEIPGCDSLDSNDYYVDVVCNIEAYTDVPEDCVQELKVAEGEVCGGEELCTSFANCYFNDFCHWCKVFVWDKKWCS